MKITLWKHSKLLSWLQKSCLFRLFWIWNSVNYKNLEVLSLHLYKWRFIYYIYLLIYIYLYKYKYKMSIEASNMFFIWFFSNMVWLWNTFVKFWGQYTSILPFPQHWTLTLKHRKGCFKGIPQSLWAHASWSHRRLFGSQCSVPVWPSV